MLVEIKCVSFVSFFPSGEIAGLRGACFLHLKLKTKFEYPELGIKLPKSVYFLSRSDKAGTTLEPGCI